MVILVVGGDSAEIFRWRAAEARIHVEPVYYRKRSRRSNAGSQTVPGSLYPFSFREDV
jgi:hypothetical protein